MRTSTTVGLGQVLFRFRSITPVPVIAILGWMLYRSRGTAGPGGPELDAALDVAGIVLALLGQALRFYTLGQVQDGTSGQDNHLVARQLNTRGPYAYVRNPLYVGNLGIVLGLMLIAHAPWVYALGLGFFFGEYFFIIRAEENFLRSIFGERYEEFLRKVPRWIPRLTPAYEGRLRAGFDAIRALKKECNPFAAWAGGAVVLLGWEAWARGELTAVQRTLYAGTLAALSVFLLAMKAWKRGWLSAARTA